MFEMHSNLKIKKEKPSEARNEGDIVSQSTKREVTLPWPKGPRHQP